jgi:SAM-dependent methyltransferase
VEQSVPAQYFIDLYKRQTDPWNFEHSEYERRKYRATLDALPRPEYEAALELACAEGVFTRMLAPRCGSLLAVDVSPDALQRARRRCGALRHVRFRRGPIPSDFPPGRFDLITVCEVGFYLSADDLYDLRSHVLRALVPDGNVVLVHWTPPVNGHASTAEQVHDIFCSTPGLHRVAGFSADTYRLDLLERRT